jgi:hypothetical protein
MEQKSVPLSSIPKMTWVALLKLYTCLPLIRPGRQDPLYANLDKNLAVKIDSPAEGHWISLTAIMGVLCFRFGVVVMNHKKCKPFIKKRLW